MFLTFTFEYKKKKMQGHKHIDRVTDCTARRSLHITIIIHSFIYIQFSSRKQQNECPYATRYLLTFLFLFFLLQFLYAMLLLLVFVSILFFLIFVLDRRVCAQTYIMSEIFPVEQKTVYLQFPSKHHRE